MRDKKKYSMDQMLHQNSSFGPSNQIRRNREETAKDESPVGDCALN